MAQLTEKELIAISEQLTAEQLTVCKLRSYASMATDSQIKEKCEQLACKHQNHFDTLFSCLG